MQLLKALVKLIICIIVCSLTLTSCMSAVNDFYNAMDKNSQYYKGAGWDCDAESFETQYSELYEKEMQLLLSQYNIDPQFDMSVESLENEKNKINICLYSEEYTFVFALTNIGWYGGYNANLYYYDVESKDKDYAEFAHLVNLLNDFTNYVAYDTKNEENHFELLLF